MPSCNKLLQYVIYIYCVMFGMCGMNPAIATDLHPLFTVGVSNITCCSPKYTAILVLVVPASALFTLCHCYNMYSKNGLSSVSVSNISCTCWTCIHYLLTVWAILSVLVPVPVGPVSVSFTLWHFEQYYLLFLHQRALLGATVLRATVTICHLLQQRTCNHYILSMWAILLVVSVSVSFTLWHDTVAISNSNICVSLSCSCLREWVPIHAMDGHK
jgi:hypothetical protein